MDFYISRIFLFRQTNRIFVSDIAIRVFRKFESKHGLQHGRDSNQSSDYIVMSFCNNQFKFFVVDI